jgi:DnaJ-class molecular chaperone
MMRKTHSRRINIPPIRISVCVTLEDVYLGKIVDKDIERYIVCQACNSTGFKDKKNHICTTCKGQGSIRVVKQLGPGFLQQFEKTCSVCKGTGKNRNSSLLCNKCTGNQVIKQKATISITIPKGVKDGDVITIKNKGNEIPLNERTQNGITRGNVQIVIKELEHKIFKRGIVLNQQMDPSNICLIVDLSFEDSIIGFKKKFKHLDGRLLFINENEIVQDGDTRVVLNEGLPIKGKDWKKGDLFIKFNVKIPNDLTYNQKINIYKIITGKDYKEEKISEDYHEIYTRDIKSYKNDSQAYDSDSDNEDFEGNHHDRQECTFQ